MVLEIIENCIACRTCILECLNKAISEDDPIHAIDPNLCTENVGFFNEPQCVNVCPVESIDPDPDE